MLQASLYHLQVSESYLGSWPTSKTFFARTLFLSSPTVVRVNQNCFVSAESALIQEWPFHSSTSTLVVLGDSTSHLALCLSPLLHPTFSTVPPFRHQAISALFPTQQICSLEPFPEYFGIHPCPLPICSLVWHRSRGQRGGSEGGGGYTLIVTVPSRCS